MAEVAAATSHSPSDAPKRPKGILKNSHSQQQISPSFRVSPTSEQLPSTEDGSHTNAERPGMPSRELSEKEIVQMNTEMNAGALRRNSSNPRSSLARRQSDQSNGVITEDAEDSNMQRLKWDEANLYLNEGQMGGKMKIDEPKTPFVGKYDPSDDDDPEAAALDPDMIVVDELEKQRMKQNKKPKDADIPGLDLGEPELEPGQRHDGDTERKVLVNTDAMDVDGGTHGEEGEENISQEDREKHRKFEEMRKKHYEMKNIKNLLAHNPDELESLDAQN